MWRCSAVLFSIASSACAQDGPIDFPLAPVMELAMVAHLGRDGFAQRLAQALPDLVVAPSGREATGDDPWLYSISGHFGGTGAHPRPGAIFACGRYGLATRDLFVEHGFSTPETFALMGDVRPLIHDSAVWVPGAIARLHCTFVWDDAETVRILGRGAAELGLAAFFETVETPAAALAPVFGAEGGYDLLGTNAADALSIWVESGWVELTNGHQEVSFRAFLMGGAV